MCPSMNHLLKTSLQTSLVPKRHIWTEVSKRKSYQETDAKRHSTARSGKSQNNYEVLGVSRRASHKEIKSAYYSLSKTCHPDVSQSSEAAHRFREISDAYEVLGNKESKRVYDQTIGNHLNGRKVVNNAELNQQNLDNYRDFQRWKYKERSVNDSNDGEQYHYDKWRKRRNLRKENNFGNNQTYSDRYAYRDPLNYEPNDFFTQQFNEEMQKRYAEQIDRAHQQYAKETEEAKSESGVKAAVIALIVMIPLVVNLWGESMDLRYKSIAESDDTNNGKSDGQ